MSCSDTTPNTPTQQAPAAVAHALAPAMTHGVATPENWQPGDKVLVGSPKTVAEVEKRLTEGLETTDWYFTVKNLD